MISAAPGMFSTMIVGLPAIWRGKWRIIKRATMSLPPPAAEATMTRSVLPW
ncbi:MAG: hypothetical protein HYY82_08060 [Deltaproteobacteria bacterium]|nr:hypothetical protein [Deltaproteobacteria bacterium]